MSRPEIRKINSKKFVQHFGTEIKFVTEEMGHLWLCFRNKPRAVIIPMRDEELLHDIQGRSFEEILHKANVRRARTIRAAYRLEAYKSELVEENDREIPYRGLTDPEWDALQKYWFDTNGIVR